MKDIIIQDGGGRGLKLRVKCGFSRSALRKLNYSYVSAGDTGLIHRSGRSPGIESGNLLQYSCLGNSMDGGD